MLVQKAKFILVFLGVAVLAVAGFGVVRASAAPSSAIYDNGTNVGIGTTNPVAKLEVDGANGAKALRIVAGASGVLASFGGNGDVQVDAPGIVGGRFIIKDGSGNVGIGTANPSVALQIGSTAPFVGGGTFVSTGPNFGVIGQGGIWGMVGYNTTKPANEVDISGATYGLIVKAGNVGIGTISPTSQLSVGGNGVSGAAIYGASTASGGYGVYGSESTNLGSGIYGANSNGFGVDGNGLIGVYGTGTTYGVEATTNSSGGYGVYGGNTAGSGTNTGVYGVASSGNGVWGSGTNAGVYGTGNTYGVYGLSAVSGGTGVYGNGNAYDFKGAHGEYTSGGTWTNASDRNLKENFIQLDDQAILDKIVELPVTQWVYKSDPTALHIGPVAQDFYAIFGLGDNNVSISTVDPSGVALVGIKALNEKIDAQQQEIATLTSEVQQLMKK